MSENIKYIELVTWNKKMILLYGDKLTRTQKAIGLRSNGLHSEIRWSSRYGRTSSSCTLADGCGCYRFKDINYSHPYRQSRVRIPVTSDQESRLFTKACEMADIPVFSMAMHLSLKPQQEITEGYKHDDCYYGPNAIKYDKNGASFAFISKLRIWRMHPERMICNEACANVLLTKWKDLLCAGEGATSIQGYDPADLTPDQLDYMARYYFETKSLKGE